MVKLELSGLLEAEIINIANVQRGLRKASKEGVNTGMRRAMRAATITVQSRAKKLVSGPVLNRRTSRLYRSIQPEVVGFRGRIMGYVGSDVKYAAYHEFGTKRLPRRPFLSRALKEEQRRINRYFRLFVKDSVNQVLDGQ